MNNLFDTDNYPEGIPAALVVGTFWGWNEADITAVYPTAIYTLKYYLNLQVSPFTSTALTANKTGDVHTIEVADTSAFVAGEYNWQAAIVRDSDSAEVIVAAGVLVMSANLQTTGDTRSWVAQTLDAVRATLQGTASREISSYTIGGRSLAARTPAELLDLEREFSKRLKQEQAAAGKKPKRVLVGMGA